MKIIPCPSCKSNNYDSLYPEYTGATVTSSFEVVKRATLDNRLCKECGLIFNARGVRDFAKEFYSETYNLMLFSDDAEVQSYTDTGPVSQAEYSYKMVQEMVGISGSGMLLEIGAGKGYFLRHFYNNHSEWRLTAFEPGMAFEFLEEQLSDVETYQTDYQGFTLEKNAFDLIVALGVLEHVEQPLDMLRWANKGLKQGGKFFIRVPNFEKNPNDLFCVDHLSKLTVPTLHWLATESGFEISASKGVGVQLYLVLEKKGTEDRKHPSVYESNRVTADKNADYAQKSIKAILSARSQAQKIKENFGIFGLATSGLFAPFIGEFDPAEITAYIDENKTMWGALVHGRPVGGLNFISEKNIKHIALTISPAYIEKVSAKLRIYPAKIYTP